MTRRRLLLLAASTVAAGAAAALTLRWPAILASVAVLALLAAVPLPVRKTRLLLAGALLTLAVTIVVTVAARPGITPGADVIALVTDPARDRERLVREASVAGALMVAGLLFAGAILRHLPTTTLPRAAPSLVIGALLLIVPAWMAAGSVWESLESRLEPGDGIVVTAAAVAVALGPDLFSGLALAAPLAAAVLLVHACAAEVAQ